MMQGTRLMRWTTFGVGLAGLAACTGTPQESAFDKALTSCMFATNAPGNYSVDAKVVGRNGLPLIRAAEGGTPRGEILLNACVEQQVREAGVTVAAPKAPPAKPGKLALPTQYVLLPGDAELWATLTREQQERALGFLKDGSTIRSSLLQE